MLHTTEGTISYISVLIKKKMSLTRIPMTESGYYLASIWTQKGKVRLIEKGVAVCRQ